MEEKPPEAPAVSEREMLGIESYLEANVLQRNATWNAIPKSDHRQLALNWILHEDKMQLETLNERLSQRYILALLAFSLDSLAWNSCGNHTASSGQGGEYSVDSCKVDDGAGRKIHSFVWLSNSNECDWYGVTCVDGAVKGLDVSK